MHDLMTLELFGPAQCVAKSLYILEHASLVYRKGNYPLFTQWMERSLPVDVKTADEYSESSLHDSRGNRWQLLFLIGWVDYDSITQQQTMVVKWFNMVGKHLQCYAELAGLLKNDLGGSLN